MSSSQPLTGYCTVADVGDVLQDSFAGANPSESHVASAIVGQNEWLVRTTERHFYDPEYTSESGDHVTLPTKPRVTTEEVLDAPESPHAQYYQLVDDEQRRYPHTRRGRFVRLQLNRRDASTITGLKIRSYQEYEDWLADPRKEEGRAGDYYLEVDPHTHIAELYLDATHMGPLADWKDVAVVSYEYGDDAMPSTIRRAVANRAAAELIVDDDANVQIPDSGAFVSVKTKADEFRETANSLLSEYTSIPIA